MEAKQQQGEAKLLQYIKDILAEPAKARLELAALPKEQHELAKGLQNLASCMLEQQRRLEASAHTDSLTGIGNRLALISRYKACGKNVCPVLLPLWIWW